MDGHPGHAPDGGRGREAHPHGGAPPPPRDRPGGGGRRRLRRPAPLTRRPVRPRPPDRHLPVPRPDRRRQDRAGARAGRVHVRLAGRDGPDRHVRVHGEALRLAAGRRAARLRRLRGGRPAHRGRPPPPVLGRAARRDREGAQRRLQRAAAGDGRRPPDRRPGPDGRLQERRADHDLQHPRGPRGRRGDLQAGVHQPARRHRRVRGAVTRAAARDRRPPGDAADRPRGRARRRGHADRRGARPARRHRLRPDLRRPPAQARDLQAARRPAGARPAQGRVRGRRPDRGRRRRRRAHLHAHPGRGAGSPSRERPRPRRSDAGPTPGPAPASTRASGRPA